MSVLTPPTSASAAPKGKGPDLAAMWQEIIEGPPQEGMTTEEIIAFRESKEGKALIGWIQQKFQAATDARQKEERQWNYNLAMYNGNQWVLPFISDLNSINGGQIGTLGQPRAGSNRQRQTINRIKPVIRTEISKFIAQKPGASVIPASDEDDDILMAQAAEQAWLATSSRCKLDKEYRKAIFWMGITGSGFIRVTWNPEKYDKDAELLGDVDYGSIKPYELFFADLEAKDVQEQPFIIHAYAKSSEWLRMKYEDILEGKPLNPSCKKSTIQEASYAAPMKQDVKTFDSNMLTEFWCKPGYCPFLKEGGVITLIDDILVAVVNTGLPYKHGKYPFIQLCHIETERFYTTSIIPDLIDLQKDYNSLRSQIAESRKKMGKPQILAPKGSISAAKLTNEIGLVIEYKFGTQPPQAMPIQNLPTYILQEVDLIKADIEDISGQHEVSKGQTPPGVTAATAISYLQESDDAYQLPSFKNIEEAWGDIAEQTLELLVQYWDEEHLVKITGAEDAFSIKMLRGSDLEKSTDVRVEPGSSLPQSKAAKMAFVMDLMTNQFIPPEEGLDILEIGGTQKLLDRLKNDRRQAQRENIKFKRLTAEDLAEYDQQFQMNMQQQGMEEAVDPMTGMPLKPPLIIHPNTFDNHELHIEEHNAWRKGQEYENLPPEIQQLVESHVQQHKAMMQQDMLQQTMSQIPTDGSINEGVDGSMDGEPGEEVPPEMGAEPAPTDNTQPAPMEA